MIYNNYCENQNKNVNRYAIFLSLHIVMNVLKCYNNN